MAKNLMLVSAAVFLLSAAVSIWIVADSVRRRNEFIRVADYLVLRTNGDAWLVAGDLKYRGNIYRVKQGDPLGIRDQTH